MTPERAVHVSPPRPGDPAQLGAYQLLGRLGEGGMGTVFLGEHRSGRRVAVKIIRTDRADDTEFRLRFRGEVERARQVPPFCTAEVLDADPDHDPPYLVAEYVDGPSLGTVVAERGPLTQGNLYGLAIGVATALTAIHGAGVIHRDLKPSNVLLPPGTPKVIDFGIARATHGEGGGATGTGQVIGTVSYMAPERFDPAAKGGITPAADIFAWGVVVAYAGTGRTPFAGDSPHETAMRILTAEPVLDGLAGPLRTLVERALAKDPSERPTARELLDLLLSGPAQRGAALADTLVGQPGLLAAAEQAQAATDRHQPVEAGSVRSATPPARSGRLPGQGAGPTEERTGAVPRWHVVSTVVLTLTALVGVLAVVGLLTGVVPLPGAKADRTAAPTSPTGSSVTPARQSVPSWLPVVSDPLTTEKEWIDRVDDRNKATCAFDGGLVVRKRSEGPYRCQGPLTELADFRAEVTVSLRTRRTCAGVWFRFTDDNGGYVLRVCPTGYYLARHRPTGVEPLERYGYPNGSLLATGQPTRVAVEAIGSELRFYRDGVEIAHVQDEAPVRGRVVLGIFRDPEAEGPAVPPFEVSFRDVEIVRPG